MVAVDALRPMNEASHSQSSRVLPRHYHLEVDWDLVIEDLPVGVQQRIEIFKLLYHEASILILDEPTAVLTPQETDQLFANLEKASLPREKRSSSSLTNSKK